MTKIRYFGYLSICCDWLINRPYINICKYYSKCLRKQYSFPRNVNNIIPSVIAHNLQLPTRTSGLEDNNFLIRTLFSGTIITFTCAFSR